MAVSQEEFDQSVRDYQDAVSNVEETQKLLDEALKREQEATKDVASLELRLEEADDEVQHILSQMRFLINRI